MPVMFATTEEAELAFYDALERADINRLMQVWSDEEEIVCVHPGGLRVVGHHAVQESWQEIPHGPGRFRHSGCRALAGRTGNRARYRINRNRSLLRHQRLSQRPYRMATGHASCIGGSGSDWTN